MRIKNILSTAGAVFAAAALAILPTAARAQEVVDADAVVFTTDPAAATVCWIDNLCGSPQTYSFSANTCIGASVDLVGDEGSPVDAEVPASCSLPNGSNGSFINIVCGTGVVFGNQTDIVESGSDTYHVNPLGPASAYTIVFAGGVGVLVAPSISEGPDDADLLPGVGGGVVQITPNPLPTIPPNPTGACTTGFSVNAVLVTNA